MTREKLTTYDYLASKGKRQLSNLFVHTVEEGAADNVRGAEIVKEDDVVKQPAASVTSTV